MPKERKDARSNADPDKTMTQDQDNYNNFSNYQQSKAIGDAKSAKHWRDNWLGEVGRDQ